MDLSKASFKGIYDAIQNNENISDINKKLSGWFRTIFESNKVPILDKSQDNPYNETDFCLELQNIIGHLTIIQDSIANLVALVKCKKLKGLTQQSLDALVLCCVALPAQYHSADVAWGSAEAAVVSNDLLQLLLVSDDNDYTALELLEGKKYVNQLCYKEPVKYKLDSALNPLLQYLSNNFTKHNWKNDPGSRELYLWLMHNLPGSLMSQHLGLLLPGSLLLLDDWELRHKLAALSVLHRMLQTLAGHELRQFGRAGVVHAAARQHLYSREPELLKKAYPVAILAAEVLDEDPGNRDALIEGSSAEAVLCLLLREMGYEQRLDLRRVFAANLRPAVRAAGVATGRWCSQFTEVATDYLATYEGDHAEDKLAIMQAIQEFARGCWLSVEPLPLLTALVKLLYDIELGDNSVTEQAHDALVDSCRECVELLCRAHPETCKTACHGLVEAPLPDALRTTLHRVMGNQLMPPQLLA